MGAVFEAEDADLRRPVAIKLLTPARRHSAKASARLLAEARAMARLNHPHVVQVFDHGQDPRHGPYVVMERLEGEDLGRHLRSHGPWEESAARELMWQVCSALDAAHQRGILHRDLKPSNVFLCQPHEGGRWRAKVLDFGLARLEDAARLTEPGDLLGTLAYLPPERWGSALAGDERADVYGLAAIFYEALGGAPPFQATRRAELALAICHDLPPLLTKARPELTSALAEAIARGLAKEPGERFSSVADFALALGLGTLRGPGNAEAAGPPLPRFAGTARYQVKKLLARTASSELYEGFDSLRRRRVVLKRARPRDAEALARLKREYRTLGAFRHPNVLRVEDCWEDGGHVVLVSELVDGVDVLTYLGGHPSAEGQVVAQLGEALAALHARGLVHGDLKPAHVLVKGKGEVVLVDFGLTSSPARARGAANGVVPEGTSAYAAPELWEGEKTAAIDLYALGVILWQIRHQGALPPWLERDAKTVSSESGESPRGLGARPLPGADARAEGDISQLLETLLAEEPARRGTAEGFLAAWQKARGDARGQSARAPGARARRRKAAPATPRVSTSEDEPVLVGRDEALTHLAAALARASARGAELVGLTGPSGIGKTALLERFRRTLEEDGETVSMSTCARAAADFPFPALDAAVDALAAQVRALPPALVDHITPRGVSWLLQLFPVLGQVPGFAQKAREASRASADGEHARARAFSALRELLCRLAERRRTVLLIDDAQWIDADSAALLTHLVEGPEPPRLLVLLAMRANEGSALVLPAAFERGVPCPQDHLHLGPLSDEDAALVLSARWRGPSPLSAARARALAQASGGVPFLLDLMALAAATSGTSAPPADAQEDLSDLIRARLRALPTRARSAFTYLSLATRPLPWNVLLRAARGSASAVLDPLLESQLVRTSRAQGSLWLEPAHARLAEAIRRRVPQAERRRRHLELAEALRAEATVDPQQVASHLAEAGEHRAAAEVALQGARQAVRQLAFDRAAALYEAALEHGRFEAEERAELHLQLARALADAGRLRRAGDVLLRGASAMPPGPAREALERQGGIHLLLSGDVTRGLGVLGPALAAHALELPTTTEASLGAIMASLGALLARGLDHTLRSAEALAPSHETARVDLALAVAQGLEIIDVRALLFAVHALAAALELGEPTRLQRATSLFVRCTAISLPNPLIAPAFALCRTLTAATDDPYAAGLLHAAAGQIAHFEGDFMTAEACLEQAERALTSSWTGASRELHVVRDVAVFMQYAHKGDFRSQLARTQAWLAEGEAADDLFHVSMLRVAHAIVWIAHDQPARAAKELATSRHQSTGVAGVVQVVAALYGDIVARYTADEETLAHPPAARAEALASPAAETPFLRGYLVLHDAWRALRALAAASPGEEAGASGEEVQGHLASLRASGLGIWDAVADALEANLVFLGTSRTTATTTTPSSARAFDESPMRLLVRAEQALRRLNMPCLAASARKRRGQLLGGDLGARLETEADGELRSLGVAAPDRWCAAYWSMFTAEAAASSRRLQGDGELAR